MKNKIFTIILSIILSLPITVWAVDDTVVDTNTLEQTPVVNQLDEDINNTEYKQPTSKRKIAKKFLTAMGGVAVSSFALFFLLTIYNKIRGRYEHIKTVDNETTLETPQDYGKAVKIFLEKTRW